MKEISIDFNFWYNDEHIEIELAPLIISDKIIPGDSGRQIETLYPAYTYSNINDVLLKNLKTRNGEK
jgi:hypothetical protein